MEKPLKTSLYHNRDRNNCLRKWLCPYRNYFGTKPRQTPNSVSEVTFYTLTTKTTINNGIKLPPLATPKPNTRGS